LKKLLQKLGQEEVSDGDVEKMIKEVDLNKNDVVEFSEFLKVNIYLFR
jgi:Ca2+-binding EF-hand superfamily protein